MWRGNTERGQAMRTPEGGVNPLYGQEFASEFADLKREVAELRRVVQNLQARL